jgi:hypothetical protein
VNDTVWSRHWHLPELYVHPSNGSTDQIGPWPPPLRFLNHTQLDTHGRTPLDEWSARRRDLYLHRTTQHITIHAPSGIRTLDPSNQPAADLRRRPVTKLLKVHWHGRNVHVTFHKSLKLKVHVCKIGWSGWPRNMAAITYSSPRQCLVETPRDIPVTLGRGPSSSGTGKCIWRGTWPATVASAKKNGPQSVLCLQHWNIHLSTVSHMFDNFVRILWSPDDRILAFHTPW